MKLVPLLFAVVLLAPSVLAEEQKEIWKLPPNTDYDDVLPPPPSDGSPMALADLAYTLAVQADATPEAIAEAQWIAGFSVFTFSEVLGPTFTAGNYPKTAAFFEKLEATVNVPKNYLKDKFGRIRPWQAHEGEVKRLVPDEKGFSYPSGHATRSWCFALFLGELDPEYQHAFIRQANKIGYSRVLGGMHYVSDIILSRQLAQLLYEQLKQDEEFRKDFEALRKEEWTPAPKLLPAKS